MALKRWFKQPDVWGFPKLKEFWDKSIIDVSTPCLKSEMTFGLTKGWILRYVIMHNVIWANQKTECFVYRWLHPHAMVDVMCFPTFVWRIGHHFKCCVDTLIELKTVCKRHTFADKSSFTPDL